MEHLHDIMTAYVIGGFAGAVRYVASTLGGTITFKFGKLIAFIFVCGGFGIPSYWVAVILRDHYSFPDMSIPIFIYGVCTLAKETIETLVKERPRIITSFIDIVRNLFIKKTS